MRRLRAGGGGDELAAAAADRQSAGRRHGRPAVQRLGAGVGIGSRDGDARRRRRRVRAMVERQHLSSRPARARVLGAPGAADPDGPSALVGHGQHPARLQHDLSRHQRPVRAGDVPARARADGPAARGAGRRPLLRVRALPHRAAASPAGALVAVDAVCPLRLQALPGARPRRRARGRGGRARRTTAVLRLLSCLLQPVRGALPHLGDHRARSLA